MKVYEREWGKTYGWYCERMAMDKLLMLKEAWQAQWEKKRFHCVPSLRVEDRIVSVKSKLSSNKEVLLVLKRAKFQGPLSDMAKTYSTVIAAKNLVQLEILYFTPHLKDVLQYCVNLQDLSITDTTVDTDLVRLILRSPLTNSCTFSRCKFETDALDAFFELYFRKTLRRNWFSESALSDSDEEEMMKSQCLDLTEFGAQSFPGSRIWLNFVLRITDGKRMGTTQLSFLNCTFMKRLHIIKNLHPEPVRALRQIVQDVKHIISSLKPWDDYYFGWSISPVEAVANRFNSSHADSSRGMSGSVDQEDFM
ncbi:uncharacterized protein LOC100899025 [Galendromus occidentalis]|uniref:Uncharacterized protein LOC100899025 n=1 Tax=Galendromus occidentalis TaxID=34638 RepID=A0AAJ6VV81_9ACAR|nr:uncharacterized protein LOC100899025 [Galendromus occidentalis]